MEQSPSVTSTLLDPTLYGSGEAVYEVSLHEPEAGRAAVNEAFVHDLWMSLRFRRQDLRTFSGEPIAILSPGSYNRDGGPDFRNATLRIGEVEWKGDVEIHITSSGWTQHRHDEDARYDSVILHVVLEADLATGRLVRSDRSVLPELVLLPHLEAPVQDLMRRFRAATPATTICAPVWQGYPADRMVSWLKRLYCERMEMKRDILAGRMLLADDPDQVLYEGLMGALGLAKNVDPMLALARRVQLRSLSDLAEPADVEALLFGTAGLLPEPRDLLKADRDTTEYAMELRDRYDRLVIRHPVAAMNKASWQFFRLRPGNFPTLRIAQAAAMVTSRRIGLTKGGTLVALLECLSDRRPLKALRELLRVTPSLFWSQHYRLDKACAPRPATLGEDRIDILIINVILPYLLWYSSREGDLALEARLLDLPESAPAESDETIRHFASLGAPVRNALLTQGLHQLYRTRCTEHRCLTCPIGQLALAPYSQQ